MLTPKIVLVRFLTPFACALCMPAFAVPPEEPLTMNPGFKINTDQRSIEIQGLGNRILDAATAPKYLVRVDTDKTEYAYSFKRMTIANEQYTGNPKDLAGYIFFKLTVYINGDNVQEQTTAFVPSKYSNAIHFLKMDRDEKSTYSFDLGIDSSKRIYIITSPKDVVYLTPQENIKKPVSIKERNKQYVF